MKTMMSRTTDQLKVVDMSPALARILLLLPLALALAGSWYAVRWYAGYEIASYAPRMEQGGMDAARSAIRLAPDDPWTHWFVAGLEKRSFAQGQLLEAVRQYEEAVRLSPNNYEFWMDLGRAREQAGDPAGGEQALRRAVELAPAYFYPRWYLGNLLLRRRRGEEAFTELRRGAEAAPTFRPQIFNAAWDLYGGDVRAIKDAIGNSAAARAELINYLVGRGRLDDALQLWSDFTPAEKEGQRAAGEKLMQPVLDAKRYHTAFGLYRDLWPEAAREVAFGRLINGGFESDIIAGSKSVFGWQINSTSVVKVGFDPFNRRGGSRSLRVAFSSPTLVPFNNISQLVLVEPGAEYRFQCYVRAQDLKSAGTPFVEIVNMSDGSVLGASTPLPNGDTDWQLVTIGFKTSAKTEAISVRTNRVLCGADEVCPIYGMVWYDDFNLQRAGGSSPTQNARAGSSSVGDEN